MRSRLSGYSGAMLLCTSHHGAQQLPRCQPQASTHPTSTALPPFREPLRTTLIRTVAIAVAIGGLLAWRSGSMSRWIAFATLVLWFSFGGHWVELWFLNWLRPRLPETRAIHLVARIAAWFCGGAVLGLAMQATSALLPAVAMRRTPGWYVAGVAFVGVELIVHAALALRRQPNFYDGRG
jgi:hypothetical protein